MIKLVKMQLKLVHLTVTWINVMPILTNRLRWFIPRIKIGVVQEGPAEGNYIWGEGEPVLQQLMERTDAEIDMFLRLRNEVVVKEKWVDVQEYRE